MSGHSFILNGGPAAPHLGVALCVVLSCTTGCGPVVCVANDHPLTPAEIAASSCEAVTGDVDLRGLKSGHLEVASLRQVSGAVKLPAAMPAAGELNLEQVGQFSLFEADWTDLTPLASLQRSEAGFELYFDWALQDLVGFDSIESFGVNANGVAGKVSCLAGISQAEADAFELQHDVEIEFWVYPSPECSVD